MRSQLDLTPWQQHVATPIPLATHTSRHAGLRGLGNADSRDQRHKEFFFFPCTATSPGERARMCTIRGDSIRFIFLPWWGQIDRKTHAGVVVLVVGAIWPYHKSAFWFSREEETSFFQRYSSWRCWNIFKRLLLITITTFWSERAEEEEGRTLEL